MLRSKRRAEKRATAEAAQEEQLRQTILNLIAIAKGQPSLDPDWPLLLRAGEQLVSTIRGAGLFEPRRAPGHWAGRSAGVSVPVAGRLRVRVGQSAGTFVQGAEKPTVIDTGDVSITTERVVFQGAKYTREWAFSKLIGVIHYSDQPATAVQVSDRQKTSGIVYAGVSPEPFRLTMTVAIAIFQGQADETVNELRDELAKLDAKAEPAPALSEDKPDDEQRPSAIDPEPTPEARDRASSVPSSPSWNADPTGRHQWRYWDGQGWTAHVGDDGRQTQDPLPSEH